MRRPSLEHAAECLRAAKAYGGRDDPAGLGHLDADRAQAVARKLRALAVQAHAEGDAQAAFTYREAERIALAGAGLRAVRRLEVTDLRAVPLDLLMIKHGPAWEAMEAHFFRGGPEIPGLRFIETLERLDNA